MVYQVPKVNHCDICFDLSYILVSDLPIQKPCPVHIACTVLPRFIKFIVKGASVKDSVFHT